MIAAIDSRIIVITNFTKLAKGADDRVEKDCFDKYSNIAILQYCSFLMRVYAHKK